jgi:hypothetical protein
MAYHGRVSLERERETTGVMDDQMPEIQGASKFSVRI